MNAPNARLALYNALLTSLAPWLALKKAIKFGRRGHGHEWDFRRWRAPHLEETGATRVVFVALSWGEVAVLDQLSRALEADAKIDIVWAIRDAGAQELAKRQFPRRKIAPMPFDFTVAAQNWLGAVRPDVLIVVEKFWWPNLVWGAKNRGARVVLVNGRSRGRDKTRYKAIAGFQKWVLAAFDLLLFESDSQIERVREVLPRGAKIRATGNLKFAFERAAPPPDALALTQWLGARVSDENGPLPLFIAGSTSPVDEAWALDAWQKVRQKWPCSLLLAPRRIERAGEVAAQIEARGLKLIRRSAGQNQAANGAEVLLLDSLGELSFTFRFGVAAYIGGSVEGRGHNIIEPLSWGVAVGYGPLRGDFEAAQRAAEAAGVGFRLQNREELATLWLRCGQDAAFRAEVAARSQQLLGEQRGALNATLAALKPEIEAQRR